MRPETRTPDSNFGHVRLRLNYLSPKPCLLKCRNACDACSRAAHQHALSKYTLRLGYLTSRPGRTGAGIINCLPVDAGQIFGRDLARAPSRLRCAVICPLSELSINLKSNFFWEHISCLRQIYGLRSTNFLSHHALLQICSVWCLLLFTGQECP